MKLYRSVSMCIAGENHVIFVKKKNGNENENGNEELDKNSLFSVLDLCNVYGVY